MSQQPSLRQLIQLIVIGFALPISATLLLGALQHHSWDDSGTVSTSKPAIAAAQPVSDPLINRLSSGRPQLSPLPAPQQTWTCDVVVIGGTLGGVAAAAQSMQSGATTCLIELSPWLGGQISSQGVSAIDESTTMRRRNNFSPNWQAFKALLQDQVVALPEWTNLSSLQRVEATNSCWVGSLCFMPEAGAAASLQWLEAASQQSPNSRWQTSTAFKGAEFDSSGQLITAVYAVQRIPKRSDYVPQGRPSQELPSWYSWSADSVFDKVTIRLQPPEGKRLLVIDATDTGELIGWAGIPYRLGSEARATTSESYASGRDNPDCTQAFTFPFTLALRDDNGQSLAQLNRIQPQYSRAEHRKDYSLEDFPMFENGSFFHYRRLVSTTLNNPFVGSPALGDISMINWNRGNDWIWMDPPLILNEKQIAASGQHQNWMGGLSLDALGHAEEHALMFAEWLIERQARPGYPLSFLSGPEAPMATQSGLSKMPYIREGRRILGRSAYGQQAFMIREPDLRKDLLGGRDLSPTAIGITHYAIDIHGCRYRYSERSWEASSAPLQDDSKIRPIYIPLESLVPQGIDNLLIGGKSIAATHIVNASTRVHYGEWVIGSAAGAVAGWIYNQNQNQNQSQNQPTLTPAQIVPQRRMPQLQSYLIQQGLRLDW